MTGHYKIYILDRNYENFEIYDSHTMTKLDEPPKINPNILSKVMNGDIFEINKGSVNIIHSPMRKARVYIWRIGVKNGKTYVENLKNKYFFIGVYRMIKEYLSF